MSGGMKYETLGADVLAEEYYESLHSAHTSLRSAFEREEHHGLNQDGLAVRLGLNKALISRRLAGRENLTLKSLSHMATALDCKLKVSFVPYAEIARSNVYSPSWSNSWTANAAGKAILKGKVIKSTELPEQTIQRRGIVDVESNFDAQKRRLALIEKAR